MSTVEILFSLLRSELDGTEIGGELKHAITADSLAELFSVSAKHDVAHMVGNALARANLLDQGQESARFNKATMTAVYRHERLRYELNRICEAFDRAQIPFLPLKGAVIREYYPTPWMRTSCDIDVLVHEADLDRAVSVLVSEYQYTAEKKKNYHDLSLYSPGGVHLELHFNIKEGIESLDCLLDTVWEHARPSTERAYQYELSSEFLLAHVLAHMSYHFVSGGCGIRPFIDLWLLENALIVDRDQLEHLLDQAQLLRFYQNAKMLSGVWFGCEKHTELSVQMERYILDGGIYGSLKNRVAVQQQKKKGKWSYFFHRIFLPRESLKIVYPILQKHPILTPVMQVRRWFKIAFCGGARRAARELSYNQSLSTEAADVMKQFLEDVGL